MTTPNRLSLAIAGVCVAAPALGGATSLWAQAVLLLLTAVLLLCFPPRKSLGKVWNTIFLALGGLALTAFLPARWFGVPEWRRVLMDYAAVLPATRSPQPWLSAEATCLFFAGMCWAYYVFVQAGESRDKRRLVQIYCAGVAILAVVTVTALLVGHKVPFWPSTLNSNIDFGFFPNRNQTANVLSLAGIMITACAFDEFKRRRKRALWWLGALLIVCVTLVIDYSRAGIILFFCGTAAWALALVSFAGFRKGTAISVAGIITLLTFFLLFGGETLNRFQQQSADPDETWIGYRSVLFKDALALSKKAPWLGQGLGNFEPVFAMARERSGGPNRAVHPESDWLWLAVEMGWPAVLLLLAACIFWLKRCRPFGQDLRVAAAVCGVAFALHGLVDVSGHRAGSVWPALFLFAIALNPARRSVHAEWVAPVSRIFGVLLAAIGVWWLGSDRRDWAKEYAPTTTTLARLSEQLEAARESDDAPAVITIATAALRIAPLDWSLYQNRAFAEAVSLSTTAADKDFKISRDLEPHWPDSCFGEGQVWLKLGELDRAFDAWQEALRRAGETGPMLYGRMLDAASSQFAFRAELAGLAEKNCDYLLTFLQHADRFETDMQIDALLQDDPTLKSLSTTQRKSLFTAWFQRGDRSRLFASFLAHPEWQEQGWPWLAQIYAGSGDYRAAYETARKFGGSPALPTFVPADSTSELERQFLYHPEDFQNALALYASHRKMGKTDAALATVRAVKKIKGHPSYITFLEAELWAEKGDWEEAWKALQSTEAYPRAPQK